MKNSVVAVERSFPETNLPVFYYDLKNGYGNICPRFDEAKS